MIMSKTTKLSARLLEPEIEGQCQNFLAVYANDKLVWSIPSSYITPVSDNVESTTKYVLLLFQNIRKNGLESIIDSYSKAVPCPDCQAMCWQRCQFRN